MKVYDSFGPNPRALRMFLHEKGVDLPTVTIDLLGAENRQAPYTAKNRTVVSPMVSRGPVTATSSATPSPTSTAASRAVSPAASRSGTGAVLRSAWVTGEEARTPPARRVGRVR